MGTLLDKWVSAIGLDVREYGAHSPQRPKAWMTCKATGNLRAVRICSATMGSKNNVTYLCVDVEDALTLSERTEI